MSSNKSTRRVHRGRQRIPLSRIENDVHRTVTFSEHCFGLFKKANEISTLHGVEILLVVFSPDKKKVYTFGSPNVKAVLEKYVAESENRTIEANVTEELLRSQTEADIRLANLQINVLEAAIQQEMKVNEALTEAAKDLLSMKRQMEILRSNVFQILNPQPTMPVQTTQSDDVNPSGATPF
nr:agamous-like MADS-box protein AGL61 [Ipomoea batatas]GMC69954.1 agamous-like MADS-box protein AGL61 [Ipomoea batatas]